MEHESEKKSKISESSSSSSSKEPSSNESLPAIPSVSLKRQRPEEDNDEESHKIEDESKKSKAKEVDISSSSDDAPVVRRESTNNSSKMCYGCGKKGHLRAACPEVVDSRMKQKTDDTARSKADEEERQRARYKAEDDERQQEHERELLDLTRDARTVFVSQLVLRAQERDLRDYFAQVGNVAQVKLLVDRYGKSRGIGYVEFEDLETVPRALVLSGQKFCMKHAACVCSGFPISVKTSQAEKNYAHTAEKEGGSALSANIEKRVYIIGIPHSCTEAELRKIVETGHFGVIDKVSIITEKRGKSKGFGFVSFKTADAAIAAALKLHESDLTFSETKVSKEDIDFDVDSTTGAGSTTTQTVMRRVKVGRLNEMGLVAAHTGEIFKFDGTIVKGKGGQALTDYDSIGLTSQARAAMMMQLSRSTKASELQLKSVLGIASTDDFSSSSSSSSSASSSSSSASTTTSSSMSLSNPQASVAAALEIASKYVAAPSLPPAPPSPAICLINMFVAEEEASKNGEKWEIDLLEEVKEECSAYGKVLHASCDKAESRIYLCFEKVEGANEAIQALNGRHFDGRVVQAIQFPLEMYVTKFPDILKVIN